MDAVDPLACAAFVILAFVLAGVAQVWWLAARWSRPLAIPLDGGWTVRGRRLFGGNKTLRGVVVMVPATGAAFFLLAQCAAALPGELARGLWPLTPRGYGVLGLWAGLGFMAGELPNSFLKRQLDVAPGQAPAHPAARVVCALVDRVDSIVGMLAVTSALVPTAWQTWAVVLLVGPAIHAAFSVLLWRAGVKARPA